MVPPYGQGFPFGSPRIAGGDRGYGKPDANARGYGSGSETSVMFAITPSGPAGSKALTSADGGLTWAPLAALPGAPIVGDRIVYDQVNARLFVGSSLTFGPNNGYYSDDLGATWAQCVKPNTGRFGGITTIASLGELWAVPFGVAGIFRSTDGGATWGATGGVADCTGKATDAVDDLGNAYFTVVGGFAVRSTNGINQFLRVGANGPLRDILYVADFGLVLGSQDTQIVTSPNGGFDTNYVLRSAIAGGSPTFAYSPTLGLCTCLSNSDQRNSTDGIVWTNPGGAPTFDARDALWSEIWRRYVYVGGAGGNTRIFTSEDGVTWVVRYTSVSQPNLGIATEVTEAII